MRSSIFAVAVAALSNMGGALAADLSGGMKDAPVIYEPAVSWSGLYVGVSGGAALLSSKFYDLEGDACVAAGVCPDGQGVGGLVGGGLGYNWQLRNLVFGIEGDISWADVTAKATPLTATYIQSRIDSIATVRLRTGYALGTNLFYVTWGAGFLDTQHQAIAANPCNTGFSTCNSTWQTGFTVGAGYEAMLTGNLSLKAEYLYIGTPTDAVTNHGAADNKFGFTDDVQIARIGLNYKFGGGSAVYAPLK